MPRILLAFGILSLIYYLVILLYAGWSASFSGLWLAVGVILIGAAVFLHTGNQHGLRGQMPSWLKIGLGTFFATGVVLFLVIEGLIISGMRQQGKPGLDYVVVLGAQVNGTIPSRSLKKRLDRAWEYLQENENTLAILSGGQGSGEEISEAEAMYRYLVDRGLDPERLIKEEQSTDTAENLNFSRRLMEKENPSVGIVSNNFHIFRAVAIGKKCGFGEVVGIAAPSDPILQLNYMVRESAGVIKDVLVGNM